jgi:hypothetical protein
VYRKRQIGRISLLAVALIIAVVGLSSFPTSASPTPETAVPSSARLDTLAGNTVTFDQAEATYHGARIVHNVTVNGQVGMRVHANFTVKYALDTPCQLIAYFYYDGQDNVPLESADAKYRTKTGKVSASVNFTPGYDPAIYKDLQLFIPYTALNMEGGETHDLKFYLALYQKDGSLFFGKSGWYKFQLTMP